MTLTSKMASPCQLTTFRVQLLGLRTPLSRSFKVFLAFHLLVSSLLDVATADICRSVDVCRCDSRKMSLNLNLLKIEGGSLVAPGRKESTEQFFYNPCKPFNKGSPGAQPPYPCANTLMCQENSKVFYPLANASSVQFIGLPEYGNVVIKYKLTDAKLPPTTRLSDVSVLCNATSTKPYFKFLGEKPANHYGFQLHTSVACYVPEPQGISTGSVLVILFFVFLVVYLVGGILFLRFARGAQGSEMIPNREFWMDFPLLVRDGVYFVCRGCKTDTAYYEQI